MDDLYQFVIKFKETCNTLENGWLNIKVEKDIDNDYSNQLNDNCSMSCIKNELLVKSQPDYYGKKSEMQVEVKPKIEVEKENIKNPRCVKKKYVPKQPIEIKSSVLKEKCTLTGDISW